MRNKRFSSYLAIMTGAILFACSFAAMAAEVPIMTADELKMHLGGADYTILDVRAGRDWTSSTVKVSGAERVDPGAVEQWVDTYDKQQTFVLYCA